ncbi:MAG: PAS domain S-box protein [Candidatus Bathyarchaeia archaeon]
MRNRQKPRSLKRTSRGATGRKGRVLRAGEARHRLRYPEEALHESEERFRSVAERSYDAITVTDSEGRFTFVSPSIERIVGYRPEELVGVQFHSFVPESEMPKVVRAFNRMMKGENVEGLQLEVKRKDGSPVHIEVNGSPILKEGQVLGSQGTLRDITERKHAEAALRESEAKYRTLVEQSLQGILIAQGTPPRLVFANSAMAKILGYTPDELTSLSPKETEGLVHPEDRAFFFGRFSDRLQGRPVPPRYEVRGIRKDGEVRWVDFSSNRIEYNGQPAVQATFVDITERKQAEEALRRSEERYRIINQNMSEGVWLMDMNLKPTYISPSVTRARGYTLEELYTLPLDKQLTPDSLKLALETLQEALPEADSSQTDRPLTRTLELEFIRKDGSTFWSENTFTLLMNSNDEPPGILAVSRDITERKRAEEAYRAVVQHTLQGLAILQDNRIVFANQALLEMSGYSLEETLSLPPDDLTATVHPEDRERVWTEVQDLLAGKPVSSPEAFRLIRKDGTTRWVEALASRIEYQGKPAIQVAYTDITERKRAEDALQESESRYRALFDGASDAILIHDIGGKFLEANHVACERLGYSHEELLQMTPEDINSPEYAAHVAERVEEVRKRGHAFFEIAHMRRDGTVIPIELSSRIIEYKGKPAVLSIARDITERKRMQQELERYSKQLEEMVSERTKKLSESESRFRELSDLLPQIVFEIGENGNLQFMNRAAFAATGCTEEDFRRGLNAFQMFAPEDHARATEGIQRVIAGETIGEREFTVLRRDGTSFPALVYTAPITREGKTVGLRGIAIDITQRKRAEEELRSTKERLEYVVTSNPAAIYSGKPLPDLSDWELTYLSENVAGILGYEAREFVGHPEFWRRIVHPEDRPSVLAEMPRLWETGRSTIEYRMRDKNGDYRWIREEANAVRDASGKPIEVNGYWTDITARKQAEQALRESEDRYRRLFESSPISLWEEDFSDAKKYLDDLRNRGVKDFRTYFMEHPEDVARCSGLVKILDVNRATLELYNAENVRDFVGGLTKLITKEALASFREELVALAEGKTRFESEFINQTLAGERKQIRLIVNVIPGYEDTLAKVLVSVLDLTEFKLMEERLLRSERLAAIGETAAMVGHDLRNPLQAMTGSLYLAKKLSRSERVEDRKEAVKLLDTVDDQILYMDKIVSDLQSYAGPVGAEPVETNLPNLVREAISNAQVPGNVETHVEVQEDLTSVVVDSTLLQRVLSNLIMNAVQAMPKGGNLTVTAHKEQESLTVTVQDAGEGIARENMDKIFNPFFTTKAKGQGLGLAVCRRLVEAQNGTITVTSEVGKGSTFTLKIPTSRMSGAV